MPLVKMYLNDVNDIIAVVFTDNGFINMTISTFLKKYPPTNPSLDPHEILDIVTEDPNLWVKLGFADGTFGDLKLADYLTYPLPPEHKRRMDEILCGRWGIYEMIDWEGDKDEFLLTWRGNFTCAIDDFESSSDDSDDSDELDNPDDDSDNDESNAPHVIYNSVNSSDSEDSFVFDSDSDD